MVFSLINPPGYPRGLCLELQVIWSIFLVFPLFSIFLSRKNVCLARGSINIKYFSASHDLEPRSCHFLICDSWKHAKMRTLDLPIVRALPTHEFSFNFKKSLNLIFWSCLSKKNSATFLESPQNWYKKFGVTNTLFSFLTPLFCFCLVSKPPDMCK